MRFFFIAFAFLTCLCIYFWITDAQGSGMVYPTCIFATLALVTGGYNWYRYGSPVSEGPTT
ncbi:hypothetical protein [Hymenobacter terrenus]|uniref:hypothetical protein n=1 Tax=Hymenobacter terrenus TaxID=1629124 RepID=UPI000619331F|nr:hypothetical protein [Hymenobacter terrenus]